MANGVRLKDEATGAIISFLRNSNTAERIYTLPDQSGELAIDAITSVSVTGTDTLDSTAFGKLHLLSGTAADYTVTLPTAVGNAGKSIAFKGVFALTKKVTLDGNSTQTIDGWLTKDIVSGKSLIIISDGTNWNIVNESRDRIILYQRNSNSTSHTGNTNETLIDSFLIPANTIKPNDRIVIRAEWAKTGTAGAWNVKHRFHTSAAVGGTSIMAPNPGATIIAPSTERTIVCKNSQSSQEVLTNTANVLLDLGTSQNSAKTALSVDFTVDQYLVSTVQVLNSGDTGLMSSIIVEIIRG
jgi:hypothetical protein